MWEGLLFEEQPLARRLIKTMDYFGYLGKKGPADGVPQTLLECLQASWTGQKERGKATGNEILHKTSAKGVLAPEVDGPLSPQFSFIFLEIQTVVANCKESLLSSYSHPAPEKKCIFVV